MQEPPSPTKQQKQLRFAQMKMIKQHILEIRERKPLIPVLPEPPIVESFAGMYKQKYLQLKKKCIQKSIAQKYKQLQFLRAERQKHYQRYEQKQKSLKEKQQLLRVLTKKLQNQIERTKSQYRQVSFNKSITKGVRNMSYYRLGQILFNHKARGVFEAITNYNQQDKQVSLSQKSLTNFVVQKITNSLKNEQEVGICIGYLGLLIQKVGEIAGARMWIQFTFKGSKSTVKLNDGTNLILRPRQNRYYQGINMLIEQLYQILYYSMGVKVQKSNNLYQMCQQLSQILLN